MKKPKVSPAEAVKTTYPQLAYESQQLKQAIKDLGDHVSDIEASLRRIGLHVSAWHRIAGGEDADGEYRWSRDIGFTRINDRWHIGLREWSHLQGDDPATTIYKFEDAPPWMCLEAAGKIPELLEELIARTRDIRDKIINKNAEVKELAAVLAELAAEAATTRP